MYVVLWFLNVFPGSDFECRLTCVGVDCMLCWIDGIELRCLYEHGVLFGFLGEYICMCEYG